MGEMETDGVMVKEEAVEEGRGSARLTMFEAPNARVVSKGIHKAPVTYRRWRCLTGCHEI